MMKKSGSSCPAGLRYSLRKNKNKCYFTIPCKLEILNIISFSRIAVHQLTKSRTLAWEPFFRCIFMESCLNSYLKRDGTNLLILFSVMAQNKITKELSILSKIRKKRCYELGHCVKFYLGNIQVCSSWRAKSISPSWNDYLQEPSGNDDEAW